MTPRNLTLSRVSRALDSGGSGSSTLRLLPEVGIPSTEGFLPLPIQHSGSNLQQEMSSPPTPLHLLFLGHPLAYNLIHGRLDKTRADPFSISITFAIVRNESPVSVDVGMEFLNRLAQFPCRFVPVLEDCRFQIHLNELQLFESLKDIAMPEIPFAALDQFQRRLSELMFLVPIKNSIRPWVRWGLTC